MPPSSRRLRGELSDPWGIVAAGFLGGMTVALHAPVLAALGVGAAVYGVKVLVGAAMGGGELDTKAPPLPRSGTRARFWIDRAEVAVRSLRQMAPADAETATDVAAQHTADEAAAVLDQMRRLGGQAVAVATALTHAESAHLDAESQRLQELARQYPDDQAAAQSARAVADRIEVRDRLRRAQSALDGRLQSSALGLEGLVARVAEVKAAAGAVGEIDPTADDLAALTQQVEGLRVGLADIEQVAQTALGARPPEALGG